MVNLFYPLFDSLELVLPCHSTYVVSNSCTVQLMFCVKKRISIANYYQYEIFAKVHDSSLFSNHSVVKKINKNK